MPVDYTTVVYYFWPQLIAGCSYTLFRLIVFNLYYAPTPNIESFFDIFRCKIENCERKLDVFPSI